MLLEHVYFQINEICFEVTRANTGKILHCNLIKQMFVYICKSKAHRTKWSNGKDFSVHGKCFCKALNIFLVAENSIFDDNKCATLRFIKYSV